MPLFPPSTGGTPGGTDTQIQFNDSDTFGGDSGLTYNKTTNVLTVEDIAGVSGTPFTLTTPASNSEGGYMTIAPGDAASGDNIGNGLEINPGVGSGSGEGGAFDVGGGNGGATGNGGYVSLASGNGGATSGDGGAFSLAAGSGVAGDSFGGDYDMSAGNGSGTRRGGNFSITAGSGGATDAAGGAVSIISGNATGGNGSGGNITLQPGTKQGSGTSGVLRITDPDSTNRATLNTTSLTGNRTFTFPDTTGTLGLKNQEITVYGVGTAYALTNTAAAIDFGTTDPAITLNVAGTYLIMGQVNIAYTGATVAAETATIKVRRTNNTAADLSAVVVLDLPVATTLTNTYGIFQIPPFVYTTTASNDAVTLFANVSATLGAGTIDATAIGTSLVAIRLY